MLPDLDQPGHSRRRRSCGAHRPWRSSAASPDATGHPYAGAVDATPLGGLNPVASGVLVSPTVFVTAAHFTQRTRPGRHHPGR